MIARPERRSVTAARAGGGLAAVLLAGALLAQEPPPAPPAGTFPVGLEQVTVDVVVANRKGDPVGGLTAKDFTVLEDGREQKVVSFDRVQHHEGPAGAADRPADDGQGAVATNLAQATRRGRTFVLVFDDIHMSPLGARRAKAAVAAFLEKGTRPTDTILLLSTGENFWWSAEAESGRADLLQVVKGLEGRRFPETAGDSITDYEAVQITVYRDVNVALRVQDRFDHYGGTSRQGMQDSQQQHAVQGMIDMYVDQRALEAYLKVRNRLEVTFGVLERAFKALEENRDRKAVILVSEGFVNDPSNQRQRAVSEAARRANAAVYFIDTRGLETLSGMYNAEFGPAYADQDRLAAIADIGREGDGSEVLARDTGGFSVRNTNDFTPGIVNIARESESYYLLGYVPAPRTPDGKFHKIDVRLTGKARGLVVRARKGYYDPGGETAAADAKSDAGAAKKAERSDPSLQRALDAPSLMDAIGLRMSAYALAPNAFDKVQVILAADADVSKIAFGEGTGNVTLDTLLIVAGQKGTVDRADRQVELQRRATAPRTGPIWYSFLRDFALGAGRYQAKLVVRDVQSGKIGTVALTFDVPALDALRLSTPVLSDALVRDPGGSVTPVLLARREFRRDAQLYCAFDVFGAAKGPDGLPRIKAGHELRRRGGAVVGRTEPTPVQPTSLGAVSRLIQIPLSVAAPGEYDLVLAVRDEISGKQVERIESFAVTAAPGD
jgi:VWFA-related protein